VVVFSCQWSAVASRPFFTVNQTAAATKLLQEQNSRSTKRPRQSTKDSTERPRQQLQRANDCSNTTTVAMQQQRQQLQTTAAIQWLRQCSNSDHESKWLRQQNDCKGNEMTMTMKLPWGQRDDRGNEMTARATKQPRQPNDCGNQATAATKPPQEQNSCESKQPSNQQMKQKTAATIKQGLAMVDSFDSHQWSLPHQHRWYQDLLHCLLVLPVEPPSAVQIPPSWQPLPLSPSFYLYFYTKRLHKYYIHSYCYYKLSNHTSCQFLGDKSFIIGSFFKVVHQEYHIIMLQCTK